MKSGRLLDALCVATFCCWAALLSVVCFAPTPVHAIYPDMYCWTGSTGICPPTGNGCGVRAGASPCIRNVGIRGSCSSAPGSICTNPANACIGSDTAGDPCTCNIFACS